ncbi:hypothetical protein CCUS01_07663 [Colletotrichum cuscutae]|uniref:Uncharacterized protein n=1 Tax=Colletotrichum cuscutae TaxID=1209917 RepID=A0AAI9XVD5_9PEZI|nr:hypothetical protein CCUS01_07663 [Colletotrichum cuscutae]
MIRKKTRDLIQCHSTKPLPLVAVICQHELHTISSFPSISLLRGSFWWPQEFERRGDEEYSSAACSLRLRRWKCCGPTPSQILLTAMRHCTHVAEAAPC